MTVRPLLAGLLLGVVVLSGCTSLGETGDQGFVSGDGRVITRAVDGREAAIELSGEDLDGEPLDLGDYRGEPVVVTVWGSWCGPCRAEAPQVVAAAEELDGEAQFIGINLRDSSPANGQGFERTFEVPYPSFYAPDGKEMLAFHGTLTPNSIPSFVVLDAEGRVAASILGNLPSQQTLVDLTRDVAAETVDGPVDG